MSRSPRVFCSLYSEFLKFHFLKSKHVLFWGHSLVWGLDGALRHGELRLGASRASAYTSSEELEGSHEEAQGKKQEEQLHSKQVLNNRDKDNTLQRYHKDNMGIGCNFQNPWDCNMQSCLPLMEMMRVAIKWTICGFSYLLLQPHHLPWKHSPSLLKMSVHISCCKWPQLFTATTQPLVFLYL